MTLTANIVPNSMGTINRRTVKFMYPKKFADLTRNLCLADSLPTQNESITLEFLNGNDYYPDVIQTEKRRAARWNCCLRVWVRF